MPKKLIDDYRLWWDMDDDEGFVSLRLEGSSRYKKIRLENVPQFNLVTNLLNGPKAVFVDTDKRGFGTVG